MSDAIADADRQDRVVKQAFQCREALEAYAYALLRDYGEAQDAVQDAFIVVMRRHADFKEGTSMIAWTRAIVRRKVLQNLERRTRRGKLVDRVLEDAVDAAFEAKLDDARVERWEQRRCQLRDCLDTLTQRTRDLLRVIYHDRSSYAEAAASLNMGVEAVRKALFRAKRQLRTCMEGLHQEGA